MKRERVFGGLIAGACVWVAGCASPGVPQAPSLRLPELARQLTAARAGDTVTLRWTVAAETTDGEPLKGAVLAVICREEPPASGCVRVGATAASPGPMTTELPLAGALTQGPARLMAYRVELQNSRGRSSGRTEGAFVVAGAAPRNIEGLGLASGRHGEEVHWDRVDEGDPVELRKTFAGGASAPTTLRAGPRDEGGMVDRDAVRNTAYQYTAQRVRRVSLGGRELEMRGPESAAVVGRYVDRFAPEVPKGLISVPGPGSIDLSWDADTEDDLRGYVVYRREAGLAETRLTAVPVASPSYRDLTAKAGRTYSYRVTAVDASGNESTQSEAVQESLPKEEN